MEYIRYGRALRKGVTAWCKVLANIVRRTHSMRLFVVYSFVCALLLLMIISVHEYMSYRCSQPKTSLYSRHQKRQLPAIDLFPQPTPLGNIPNFTFVINRDICGTDPVDLLVLIGSHPYNYKMRKLIRDSWGTPRADHYTIKLVFLYGRPDYPKYQQQILDESDEYGDMVQGRFQDSYDNVTIRDLMGLRWTWRQCPQAKYVMHLDDDTSVNIDHVLDALEENMPTNEDYVACFIVINETRVLREGRYALTKEVHPGDMFDSYCAGWCYWFTPGAAKLLDKVSLNHTPYRVNDAYLTGTLMTALGWKHLTLQLPATPYLKRMQKWVEGSNTAPYRAIGPNNCNVTLALLLNQKFRQYSFQNGLPRYRPNRNGEH